MTGGRVLAVLLLAMFFGARAFAETLEEVEKKLAEIRARQHTLQMRSKTEFSLETPGLKSVGTAETALEVARKGAGHISRHESRSRSEIDMGGTKTRSETIQLNVYDGQRLWTLNETGGTRQALVKVPTPDEMVNIFDIAAAFKRQRERYTLKLLPDEQIDGRDCWVIEATPQKGAAGLGPFAGKVIDYYDKTDAVQRKTVTYNHEGKVQMTTLAGDVTINGEIPPERFKFEAPKGVQLVELDKSPATGAGAVEKP